ncbi:MAG: DUF1549 domain-containing protein, partial [Planctomycetes bacterium]|nr:DUF1549 domain-containing protein [Planctomycetota bacterium]
RRLNFVLTGLPPTPEEQARFAIDWNANPDAAIESTVDRLLASRRYAEHWGRHWLDVARFAESTGGGRSLMMPDAWRFRDYVINSFHQDKPLPQLIREHIAGDQLPSVSDAQHDEQLIGVGYLILGAINYEEQDKEFLRMDVVDEQIDSLGRTFLGMTLGCCRCHDHKFDPIPTTDYYALAGIFRSTKSLTPGNVCGFVTAPLRVGYDKLAIDQWTAKDKELETRIAELKKEIKSQTSTASGTAMTGDTVSALETSNREAELKRLEGDRKTLAKLKPDIPIAMCVVDEDQPADWHLHIRGEIRNLGAVIPRGFLSVASPNSHIQSPDVTNTENLSANAGRTIASLTQQPAISPGTSGRRELAEWIASPQNPLTARVYVNRVW